MLEKEDITASRGGKIDAFERKGGVGRRAKKQQSNANLI